MSKKITFEVHLSIRPRSNKTGEWTWEVYVTSSDGIRTNVQRYGVRTEKAAIDVGMAVAKQTVLDYNASGITVHSSNGVIEKIRKERFL